LGDPAWDRLWDAAQQTGLPISFHIKGGTSSNLSYQLGKWQSAAYASVLPLQLDEPLAIMIFSGALERHPGLRLVLAESGVGWLPYFLARLDGEWRALRDKLDYAPSVPPSELFRRQVIATFEEEPLAPELIPLLGADSCMWASDYPHTDSTFPNSREAIETSLGALPDGDRRKITATNCARLYGFADVR
ncbi:MAG: amidohydrolase, partial [Actinobacteria bacterium]|nr:amidohydrolase [Actinomycetota bacterium]